MTSRIALQAFLAKAKGKLNTKAAQRSDPLTFVVGNESADLDSLCSTILYAYFRSHTPPYNFHIPLANLPRADIQLRTEMQYVLNSIGLSNTNLLTLSDLPDLDPNDTQWCLVDHNCLTGPLEKFRGHIVGCVDHHHDEDVVAVNASPRVIEPCGSCMSLIVEECKSTWDTLSRDAKTDSSVIDEDEKLARLALGPILSDTTNLTAKEKVCEKDIKAVSFIEAKISDPSFSRDQFFKDISAVKEDYSSLSCRDIFRKDYKEWEERGVRLGISCSVQNLSHLVDKAGSAQDLADSFHEWAEERNLDVGAIMTTSHPEGEFQRHLLVWGLTDEGRNAVERFREGYEGELQLETWGGGALDGESRLAWRQRNLAASRKQVGPMLRATLGKSGSA